MPSVTGLGGYFFRSANPERARAWYHDVLGVPLDGQLAPPTPITSVFAVFKADTSYFGPSGQSSMVNLRVDDLDGVLARARAAGAEVDPHVEVMEFGKFGWVVDPDGNRVELWEPAPGN